MEGWEVSARNHMQRLHEKSHNLAHYHPDDSETCKRNEAEDSRAQAGEMKYLWPTAGVTVIKKVRNEGMNESLGKDRSHGQETSCRNLYTYFPYNSYNYSPGLSLLSYPSTKYTYCTVGEQTYIIITSHSELMISNSLAFFLFCTRVYRGPTVRHPCPTWLLYSKFGYDLYCH